MYIHKIIAINLLKLNCNKEMIHKQIPCINIVLPYFLAFRLISY